jgi:phage tail-like protein
MARTAIQDPLKDFRFRLDVPGFNYAGFSKVSGLKSTTDVADYRESGTNETPQKSPGMTQASPITLERGIIINGNQGGINDFGAWHRQVSSMTTQGTALNFRKECTLTVYNALNQPARKFLIRNAWPSEYEATGDFDALGKSNSIEKLTIQNEGWEELPI